LSAKLPLPGEIHYGDTYTWIIDDPQILDMAASLSPAITRGWEIGELLLTVGALIEQ
jgi:hypothetical protein